jgi:hypothetical protein
MRVAYNLFPGAGRIQLLSCVEEHEASLEREREMEGRKLECENPFRDVVGASGNDVTCKLTS